MSTSVYAGGLGERLVSNSIEAATTSFNSLPIIDLSNLSGSSGDRIQLAAEIQDACIKTGFFYIKNHGIDSEILKHVFEQAKEFFDQPLEKKMLVDMHLADSFKGYLPLQGEQVDPSTRGDMHEAFDIGSDFVEGVSANQYPSREDLPHFEDSMKAAWDTLLALGNRLAPIFALALNLPEDFFVKYTTKPGSIMRVLHYPPQYGDTIDLMELGINQHSDYEFFTLLVQHEVAALQVLNNDGEWILAPPIEGTIVVNVGDMLQRWSNDIFKSTIHRAINRTGLERYSLPFFFGVNYDTVIEVLPSCITKQRPCKYEPIVAGAWVESRLAETYIKV